MIRLARRRSSVPALLIACLLFSSPVVAELGGDPDRISRFTADIVVQENGDLLVTEEIDFLVTPGGRKRGIFRDFPTAYRTTWGLTERVGFELLEVTRDGSSEAYLLQPGLAGLRIRIGRESVFLDEGLHRYRIAYLTDRQLLFLDDVDELYWNVTGNDWGHPINRAEARIRLPGDAEHRDATAYTGYVEGAGEDFTLGRLPDGGLVFRTTRSLSPGEGLTVAVSWPKGFVTQPSAANHLRDVVQDNPGLLLALIGLIATFTYFYWQWRRIGRDPRKGLIIPLFAPPDDLSPAATGQIWSLPHGSFGRATAFTVALTNLAIKGWLTIEEGDNRFTIRKGARTAEGEDPETLPPGEAEVLEGLFPNGSGEVVIRPSYTPAVAEAVRRQAAVLRDDYGQAYFRANTGIWSAGAALAVLSGLGGLALQALPAGAPEFAILPPFLGVFAIMLLVAALVVGQEFLPSIRELLQGRRKRAGRALLGLLLIALLCLLPLLALALASHVFGWLLAAALVALLVSTGLFWHLLKAPTPKGREVLDRIAGYRLYLSVAEGDRMNQLTAAPEMTLETFERHLPYAMALGVEQEWTVRFQATASAASLAQAKRQPRWYRSSSFRDDRPNLAGVGSRLSGGLSRTLSTASSRPSKRSSGSRGGGSSGSGGGGGGGGSW
ncbi:DUF2207 domain-containing protein [Algihabitans sp.]|uniref:DUF2207 domain-containing protein n=1 Tax=Algihabitans sp. TaxID=2821514 RepID=UPI003BA8D1AC